MLLTTHGVLKSLADAFWLKVDQRGPRECWLWQGGVSGGGYGQFHLTRARTGWPKDVTVGAHRVAWMLAHQQDIPAGRELVVDHRCNVRRCCNPAHLELTTFARNLHAGHAGRKVEVVPSGRYKIRYREARDGRIVQTSRTFATEREAQEFSRTLKAAAGASPRIAS